jgi:hypothetical protein
MTGKGVKICVTEDKSPLEVRREMAEMTDFRRIGVFEGLSQQHTGYIGDHAP